MDCPGITTTMKNKKHCCKSFVRISAVIQAINSTTNIFVNAINMYVTFNLLIPEKQAFFKNSLFTLPRQPIKLRESDKSLITVENYSINISVKIKFYYSLRDSRNFQFPLSHYKSIETISCHSDQSSHPTGIKTLLL